jgi:hypothetical protein
MARVRFTEDFDYRPARNVTIAYRAGTERTVKRQCADLAIGAGKAVEIKRFKRDEIKGSR